MADKHLDMESLSLLADDMLAKNTAEQYHRHLKSCQGCEQVFDDYQAMSFALAKLESVEPPQGFEGFTAEIMAKLPPQEEVSGEKTIEIKEHQPKISFWASVDWRQAGLCVAAVGLFFALSSAPQPETAILNTQDSVEGQIASGEVFSAQGESPVMSAQGADDEGVSMAMLPGEDSRGIPEHTALTAEFLADVKALSMNPLFLGEEEWTEEMASVAGVRSQDSGVEVAFWVAELPDYAGDLSQWQYNPEEIATYQYWLSQEEGDFAPLYAHGLELTIVLLYLGEE